jgi:hypothetical protein
VPHAAIDYWGNHPLWRLLDERADELCDTIVRFAIDSIRGPLRANFFLDAPDDYAPWSGTEPVAFTERIIEDALGSPQFYELSALDQLVCGCALARKSDALGLSDLAKLASRRAGRSFERAMYDHHHLYATWPLIERLLDRRFWDGHKASAHEAMQFLSTRTREQLQPSDRSGAVEPPPAEVVALAKLSLTETLSYEASHSEKL